MNSVLNIEGLNVSYGAVSAVRNASLHLAEGEIVTLVGPNGAGKSSLLNAAVGLVPSSGTIDFCGKSVSGRSTESIVRSGLTLSPEGRRVFSQLTVNENLTLGAAPVGTSGETENNRRRMFDLFPVLEERRDQLAGTLSGGEQQMLAIARALMSNPKVLLLDEPSLGLAPQITAQIFDLVRELQWQGHTILLVEQNVEQALSISDRGYVMVTGEIRLSGTANELRENSDVRKAYFGVG